MSTVGQLRTMLRSPGGWLLLEHGHDHIGHGGQQNARPATQPPTGVQIGQRR